MSRAIRFESASVPSDCSRQRAIQEWLAASRVHPPTRYSAAKVRLTARNEALLPNSHPDPGSKSGDHLSRLSCGIRTNVLLQRWERVFDVTFEWGVNPRSTDQTPPPGSCRFALLRRARDQRLASGPERFLPGQA